jgi:hypothetical protein
VIPGPDPDWSPAEDETPAQMVDTARQLERQARAVRAAENARSFALPRAGDAEDYCQLVEAKVAVLRERASEARAAERAERERPVTVRRLDPAATRRSDFDPFKH